MEINTESSAKKLSSTVILFFVCFFGFGQIIDLKMNKYEYGRVTWFFVSSLSVWVIVVLMKAILDFVKNVTKYQHNIILIIWTIILVSVMGLNLLIQVNFPFIPSLFGAIIVLSVLLFENSLVGTMIPTKDKKVSVVQLMKYTIVVVIINALFFISGIFIDKNNEIQYSAIDTTLYPHQISTLNDKNTKTSYKLYDSSKDIGQSIDLKIDISPANITTMHITSASLGELSVPARNVLLVADNGTRRSLTLNNVSEQDIEINVGETSRVTLIFSAAVIPGNLQIDEIVLYEKKPVLE